MEAEERPGVLGEEIGVEPDPAHVAGAVVVAEQRVVEVRGPVVGRQVAGGADDRVVGVVDVAAAPVGRPGGGEELHRPLGAGRRGPADAPGPRLDEVDRGQDAPGDVELVAGLPVDRQELIGGPGSDDAPGRQRVRRRHVHPTELAAGGGMPPHGRTQLLRQGREDHVVPLGVAAERPVRDLLRETGPGQVELGGGRVPDGGLRGGDLIGQRRGRGRGRRWSEREDVDRFRRGRGRRDRDGRGHRRGRARGGRGGPGDRRAHRRRRPHCSPSRGSRPAGGRRLAARSTTHPRGGRRHGTAWATSAISIARYTWGKVSPGRLSSQRRRVAQPVRVQVQHDELVDVRVVPLDGGVELLVGAAVHEALGTEARRLDRAGRLVRRPLVRGREVAQLRRAHGATSLSTAPLAISTYSSPSSSWPNEYRSPTGRSQVRVSTTLSPSSCRPRTPVAQASPKR